MNKLVLFPLFIIQKYQQRARIRSIYLQPALDSCFSVLRFSSDSGACGERRPEREDSDDHRLRACSGMASHHQDERSGHVCLDGSRGHQGVPVLQKQRCVEVSFRPPLDYRLRPN